MLTVTFPRAYRERMEPVIRASVEGLSVRLTPAQIGMYGLLGRLLPMGMPRDQSLIDRVRDGHAFLVRLAGVDLGYDPQVWHDHLRATNAGGYRWSDKHLAFPRQIASTLANQEWRESVADLMRARGEATQPA